MKNISTTDSYATNRLATDPYATNTGEAVSVTRTAEEGKSEVASDLFATNPLAVMTERNGGILTQVFTSNHTRSEEAAENHNYPEELRDDS
jgi:hypothetical protein